jgi:hypothetical protein
VGIVTVGSTCLFGVDNFKLHVVQVFEISFLLSLMLVAITSIDRPPVSGGRARAPGRLPLRAPDLRRGAPADWAGQGSERFNHRSHEVIGYFRSTVRVASKGSSEPVVTVISLVHGL